jgi:hypothetical protein
MTFEQNLPSETEKRHHSAYSVRAQERHARHMAKQAAREARHAARAQRVHRDWTFEVKAGEKAYTFTWRWHPDEAQSPVTVEAPEARNAPDAAESEQ